MDIAMVDPTAPGKSKATHTDVAVRINCATEMVPTPSAGPETTARAGGHNRLQSLSAGRKVAARSLRAVRRAWGNAGFAALRHALLGGGAKCIGPH